MVRRIIILIFLAILIISCKEEKNDVPRFWVWMHANKENTGEEWDIIFNRLYECGIRGVLVGSDKSVLEKVITAANKYHIEVNAWMWAMNRNDAPPGFLSVNALGQSLADKKAYVDYYKFMSPAVPGVYEFIKSKVKELTEIKGLKGIHLDYIRYVDVFLPVGLQPKYGLKQDSIMPEFDYGYHPEMLKEFEELTGRNPYDIEDYPNDSSWQQFRMDIITTIVNNLSYLPEFDSISLSAAVFPDPDLSRNMVRQDWAQWDIDYFFPMVYYNFYNKDVNWIKDEISIGRRILPSDMIFCGLYLPGIDNEKEFAQSIEIALNSGADGLSFFDYRALKDFHFEAIKTASERYGIYTSKK